MKAGTRAASNNHSRQLNPQDVCYWQSRGEPGVPANGGSSSTPSPSQPAPREQSVNGGNKEQR